MKPHWQVLLSPLALFYPETPLSSHALLTHLFTHSGSVWLSPLSDVHCLFKERPITAPRSRWRHCAGRHAPPVLQRRPEMTVDKQWEQTVTPTSIDLAPSLPLLPSTTTPHWFHLHSIYMKAPPAPPPSSTRTDKNDKWPTLPSLCHHLPVPRFGCPSHYKPISRCRNPIEWAPSFLRSVRFFYILVGGGSRRGWGRGHPLLSHPSL